MSSQVVRVNEDRLGEECRAEPGAYKVLLPIPGAESTYAGHARGPAALAKKDTMYRAPTGL